MIEFKKAIAQQLVGRKVHFKCECVMPLDFTGVVKDYEISNREIIFIIDSNGKIVRIGENHPNMNIEIL